MNKLPGTLEKDLGKLVALHNDLIAYVASSLKYKIDETMSTPGAVTVEDEGFTIFLNPKIEGFSMKAVVYHEVMHILLKHLVVLEDYTKSIDRNTKAGAKLYKDIQWKLNIGMDFEINTHYSDAFDNGVNNKSMHSFLKDAAKDITIDELRKMTAERISGLVKIKDSSNNPGSNNGFSPDVILPKKKQTKGKNGVSRTLTAKDQIDIANGSVSDLIGQAPPDIKSQALDGSFDWLLNGPAFEGKLPFDRLFSLKFGIGKTIIKTGWSKPNKRQTGFIRPPRILKRLAKNLVVVDTSGSISDKELQIFISETDRMLKKFSMKIDVIFVDTRMQLIENIKKLKDLTLPGRGGTDFNEVYEFITENRKKYGQVIFFTDGYVNGPPLGLHEDILVVFSEDHLEDFANNCGSVLVIEESSYVTRA